MVYGERARKARAGEGETRGRGSVEPEASRAMAQRRGDEWWPYRSMSVDQLLLDFEVEVARVLGEHRVGDAVIGESHAKERGSP